METVLNIGLTNAACATLLALIAALLSRWIKRPAVIHVLWLLVLLKLVTPPVLSLGVLPLSGDTKPIPPRIEKASSKAAGSNPAVYMSAVDFGPAVLESERPPVAVPPPTLCARTRNVDAAAFAVATWLTGTLVMAVISLHRTRRFARLMRKAIPAPRSIQNAARTIASRMKLARAPAVQLVPFITSPMVWTARRQPVVVLSELLLERLSRRERDTILAHELAHVRRKDHWVRFIEFATTCLFWWFPVMWWARAEMRRAEERSCDELVLVSLPNQGRSYAHALLETLDALSGSASRVPALASGIGRIEKMEERLTMIMRNKTRGRLPRAMRLLIGLGAVVVISVFPTWADQPDDTRKADSDIEVGPESQERNDEAKHLEALLELEQASARLELKLKEIQSERMHIEYDYRLDHIRREMGALRDKAHQCEADGRMDQAEKLRAEAELLKRRAEIEESRYGLKQDTVDRTAALEYALRETELEAELLATRGEDERAEELARKHDQLRRELEHLHQELQTREFEIDREEYLAQIEEAEVQVQEFRERGRTREAEDLAAGIDRRRAELMLREREATLVHGHHRLQALMERIEELQARGDEEGIDEARGELYELEMSIRQSEHALQVEQLAEARAAYAAALGDEHREVRERELLRTITRLEDRIRELESVLEETDESRRD